MVLLPTPPLEAAAASGYIIRGSAGVSIGIAATAAAAFYFVLQLSIFVFINKD